MTTKWAVWVIVAALLVALVYVGSAKAADVYLPDTQAHGDWTLPPSNHEWSAHTEIVYPTPTMTPAPQVGVWLPVASVAE